MKKFLAVATICATSFGLTSAASAQSSATASANGSVTIIRPITITKTSDLAFGRIVKPSSGTGSVAIADVADTVSASAGAVALSGITTSRAKFTIDGEGAQIITVNVPASFSMSDGGSGSISVTLDPDLGGTTTLSNTLASAGSVALNVGGSFSLPDSQATGAYSGSFAVTVAYQ